MLTSDKGFTIIEALISMTILSIVLTGIYNLVISSSRFYLSQNVIVEMQADGRTAMDFMVRELRLAFGSPIISTNVAANDTISFDRIEETGYSSGGNNGLIFNDTSKSWQENMFALSTSASYVVRIISGTGAGQVRTISNNSSTQLTISAAWGIIPDTTSVYLITLNKGFTRSSTSDNILRYRIGAGGDRHPLAENITSHSFSLPDPTTIRINLTSQTRSIDPNTKQYRYYNLTESVRRRN